MHDLNTVFIPPCQLAFVRMTGPYPIASAAAWQRLLDWMQARGHEAVDHVGFGLSIDDPRTTPADELRYDAGVKVPVTWDASDAAYVSLRNFSGGAYYKKRHVGSYAELGSVVSEARDILVPREGLIHDMSRPVLTMNYSYPSLTPPHEQVCDVCIPVLPDRRVQPRILH
jgi:AraC family transcriptional regulator